MNTQRLAVSAIFSALIPVAQISFCHAQCVNKADNYIAQHNPPGVLPRSLTTPLLIKQVIDSGPANRKVVTVKAPPGIEKELSFSPKIREAINIPGVSQIRVYNFLEDLRLTTLKAQSNHNAILQKTLENTNEPKKQKIKQSIEDSDKRFKEVSTYLKQEKPMLNGREIPTKGLAFTIADFWLTLPTIRNRLPEGYSVYIFKDEFKHGKKRFSAVVMKNISDEEFIVLSQVNGVNDNIDNKKVARQYDTWKQEFGASLYGATSNSMYVRFTNTKRNINKLAGEIQMLCPELERKGFSRQRLQITLIKTGQCTMRWD